MKPSCFPIRITVVLLLTVFISHIAYSQTYYVNYESGNDSNDGLSQLTAWKHCPGDANAANAPKNISIAPGCTILFKGGVVYRGSITIKSSGSEAAPITYKGDGWGAEKAIIDGSEPLTGWRKCASQSEGGANWQNCYINYVAAGLSAFNSRLAEKGEFLWLSQEPDQPDPFFFDATDGFNTVPQAQQDSVFLIDPLVFNQADAAYWQGSYLLLWVLPNVVQMRAIKEYIPSQNKVTFEESNNPDGYNKYSIYNSIHAIDQPGEYFFDERPEPDGTHKIILYPRNPSSITNNEITCFSKPFGIDINDESHLVVEGFEVRHFSGSGLTHAVGIGTVTLAYKKNSGIIVRNNKIYRNAHPTGGYGGVYLSNCNNSRIENNEVYECMKMKGMSCPDDSNLVVSGNILRKVGGTCLSFYTGKDCRVFNNTVSDGHGTHANGMTFYLGCERMLVYNNRVTDYNIALTLQASKDLFFVNNIFDGAENTGNVVACWGAMTGPTTFINNTIVGSTNSSSIHLSTNNPYATDPGGDSVTYRLINNIIDGGGWAQTDPKQYKRMNNLFVGLAYYQQPKYEWTPAQGEVVDWDGTKYTAIPPDDVFANYAEKDFSHKTDSKAINKGTDPSAYFPSAMFPGFSLNKDKNGAVRPFGPMWDIGAYEYTDATSISTEKTASDKVSYSKNYPNPFSCSTTISFRVPEADKYCIKVFDITGRKIAILFDGQVPAGEHTIEWDGTNNNGKQVDSGVYFYQLKAGKGRMETNRMLRIR